MKGVLLIAYVLLTHLIVYGQEDIIRWNGNERLQWNDFAGKPCDTSKFDAETFAEITYWYSSDNLKDFNFEVSANFNKMASWRRKELQCEALLKHEQLHFDIAALFAARLKKDFDTFRYTRNYRQEILNIFMKNKLEYHSMQLQYDLETNHSLNKQKQRNWEDYVTGEIGETNINSQIAAAFTKTSSE